MSFTLVKTRSDLRYLNHELLEKPFVGVDTEFRRTSKDNMKLSLLQVNDSEEIYLIDCLQIQSPSDDCSFLFSKEVKKIFHSCKEDLDAVYSWTNLELVNIFDTQLAHAFLGGSYSISYQELVNKNFGLKIDKKETRTNWLKRPLTEAQLDYAASDVEFLLEIHQMQIEQLNNSKKQDWLKEELRFISSRKFTDTDKSFPERLQFRFSKQQIRELLIKFNEIVLNISTQEKINPTLFFSKKNQKDFFKLITDVGLEEASSRVTSWRKNLIYQSLSNLIQDKIQP